MNISEYKKRKEKLDKSIEDFIETQISIFEKDTGIEVTSINIETFHDDIKDMFGNTITYNKWFKVKTRVEL